MEISLEKHLKVSIDVINSEFISYYNSLRNRKFSTGELPSKSDLEIIFKFSTDKSLIIDDILYSYILLFHTEFPEVEFILNFGHEYPTKGDINTTYNLALTYSKWLKGYNVKIKVEPKSTNEGEFPEVTTIPILINKKYIDRIYSKKEGRVDDLLEPNFDIDKLKLDFSSKDKFSKTIISYFDSNSDFISLVKILDKLNLLRYFYSSKLKLGLDYNYSNLSEELSIEKFELYLKVLEKKDVFKFNFLEISLFYLLSCHYFPYEKEDFENYEYRIESIIKYVRNISFGIYEISKNIIEHSRDNNEGFGVIHLRIYSENRWKKLKSCQEYFEFIRKNVFATSHLKNYILNIQIIDSGINHLKDKYLQTLERQVDIGSAFSKEDILKDIELVRNFELKDFFDFKSIKLAHQIKRANSRLGLLLFSNQILSKFGYIKLITNAISSTKSNITEVILDDKIIEINSNPTLIEVGTQYEINLPLSLDVFSNEPTAKPILNSEIATSTSTLKNLYNFYHYKEENIAHKTPIFSNFEISDSTDKYAKISEDAKFIFYKTQENKECVILLNAHDYSHLVTSSDWLRFFAHIQLVNSHSNQLIVVNFNPEFIDEIIEFNKVYGDSSIGFWSEKNTVLLFFKEKYNNIELWFNCAITQSSYSKFKALNQAISNYHYNYYSLKDKTELGEVLDVDKENILFTDNKLLNFELLIRLNPKTDLSLYEENIKNLLEIEIDPIQRTINNNASYNAKETFFKSLKGFKISKSHFKLGTKLHIHDFYYAKRLFYNSFYSNRFAFLISEYILNNHLKNGELNLNSEVTILGYGVHAELLVSNIRRLIADQGYMNIHHEVILEDGETVLRTFDDVKQNVIVVIPISSSFTTSMKIRSSKLFHDNHKNRRVIEPYINIVEVSHIDLGKPKNELIVELNDKENKVVNQFHWELEDNQLEDKIILKDKTRQKYFLYLQTNWENIHDCKLCFPKVKSKEICLIETEKNYVTPDAIFDLPIAYESKSIHKIESNFYQYFISENGEYLAYNKHFVKNNKDYIYFIKSSAFFKKNKPKIETWIRDLVENKYIRASNLKNNILITPSELSNSGFVDLINEIVFNDTATILKYSSKDDSFQNFRKFHIDLLQNSDIYFIDDVISTGSPYFEIKSIIENLDVGLKISKCISVINRMHFLNEKRIIDSLKSNEDDCDNFLYFIKLNIPSIIDKDDKAFFQRPYTIYKKLAQNSLLDILKTYFTKKYLELEPVKLDFKKEKHISTPKELFKLLLYHIVYSYFNNSPSKYTYFDGDFKIQDLINYVRKNQSIIQLLKGDKFKNFQSQLEMNILRILSEPPFVRYKDIKIEAFNYTLNYFKNELRNEFRINEREFYASIKLDRQDFLPIQNFKLWLRIATNLKINYIISQEFLYYIDEILTYNTKFRIRYDEIKSLVELENESIEITKKQESKLSKTDIEELNQRFKQINDDINYKKLEIKNEIAITIYFSSLVQELIFEDESKAVELIKNIHYILKRDKWKSSQLESNLKKQKVGLTLRNDFEDPFINLLKILVLENNFIFLKYFQNFYLDVEPNVSFNEEYKTQQINEKNIWENSNAMQKFISNDFDPYYSKYRTESLDRMIGGIDYQSNDTSDRYPYIEDKDLKSAFIDTCYLMTMIRNECTPNIENKMEDGKLDVKDKVKIILKYLCRIMGVDNGGAYLTLKIYNRHENDTSTNSEHLYTVNSYAVEGNELKIDLISNDSITQRVFRGTREPGVYKPKTGFEVLHRPSSSYENDINKYWVFREMENCNADFVENIALETRREKLYENLYFFRISDINEKKITEYIEYKNNGDNNKDKEYSHNLTRSIAVITFYNNSSKVYGENLAYDPKRIRFLLMLRDSIRQFIDYHLDNDSLIKVKESEDKRNLENVFNHGIGIYKSTFKINLDKLLDKNQVDFNLKYRNLNTVYQYFINKIYLISKINSEDLLDQFSLFHTNQLFQKFKLNGESILTFEHSDIQNEHLKNMEDVEFNFNSNVPEDNLLKIPKNCITEIIFELFYNIRKHSKIKEINEKNKLIINIETTIEKHSVLVEGKQIEINFYCLKIQNNNLQENNKKIRFKSKLEQKGLSLLWNLLQKISIHNDIEVNHISEFYEIKLLFQL